LNGDRASGRASKPFIVVLVAIIAALSLAGCWDRLETAEVAIVGSVGLDEGTGDKVVVSLEITNPAVLVPGVVQATGGKVVAWILREESDSIFNAIRNIERRTSKRIFFGHVNTVIFGMNLARKGVGRYLDVFERQAQFRRTMLISTCDTGAGLLQRPFIDELPSRTLSGLALTAQTSGKTTEVTLNEFMRKLNQPGIEPITMHTAGRETKDVFVKRQGEAVHRVDTPSVSRPQPLDSDESIPAILPPDSPLLDPLKEAGSGEAAYALTVIPGVAVFRGDTLRGFLDGFDARGYLWAVGRVKGGLVELFDVEGAGIIGLEVIRSNASSRLSVKGETIEVTLRVMPEFEIAEMSENISLPRETVHRIEGLANRLVEEEIRHSLRIVQEEFRSDVYGFGHMIHAKHPDLWKRLEKDWNEKGFPKVRVNVKVQSKIRSSSLLLKLP